MGHAGKDYVTLASNKAVLKRDMMTENSDTKVFLFEADKGMDVVIPLKRIQPFVEIVLQYRTHVKMATSTNTRSELIGDILVIIKIFPNIAFKTHFSLKKNLDVVNSKYY